ncbi:MAG: hypothetical protein ABGY42_07900 [bacterium]
MSRRYGSRYQPADDDMSALVVLGVLIVSGLWPVALMLVVFGFIGGLLGDD